MNAKTLLTATLLASSFLVTSQALAEPNLSPEQLAKARETASQMKPPVDFDAMLKEADRLGVKCEGDLTRKIKITTCKSKVNSAKLDEENKKLEDEIKQKVNDLADKAAEKLEQAK
jgi:hypothetical protein